MQTYEKPLILVDADLAEGVYAASGTTVSGTGCGSKWMNGVYHPMIRHDGEPDDGHTKMERGCEGCPASWNHGCHVSQCNYSGDFRPSWESDGYTPDAKWDA